jgi:phage baseplate assembly protein V
MIEDVRLLIARWQRKIAMMLMRGVVQYVDDAHGLQQMNLIVAAGDLWTGAQRFQEYGFTSTPLPGAEVVIGSIGGLRSFGVVVAVDDRRYRLQTLPAGGVALYDAHGSSVLLDNAGNITATGAGTITATAPNVVINASTKVQMNTPLLSVSGDIIDNSATNTRTMAGMRTQYNEHDHGNVLNGTGVTSTPTPTM